MRILQYPSQPGPEADLERRIQLLVLIAKALSTEVETLQRELGPAPRDRSDPINLGDEGIDFYQEIERYEIDLIRSALEHCGGNQTHAARLLQMKSTTLNAKMKHYGIRS